MKIENLMSKQVISLSMDTTLSQAKKVFENNKIHHLIITDDDGLLAGLITDRDLYKHLSPTVGTNKESHRDTALMHRKLHQIMERELITAQAQQSLSEAVVLFYDNHISCLPIINKQKEPIGIITWRDILKVLALQHKKKVAANS